MKQTDKIIIVILSVWTFIHCYLLLQGLNYENSLLYSIKYGDGSSSNYDFYKGEKFYPFTEIIINKETVCSNYDFAFYDYSEFFIYVVGAWGLLLIYKFLSKKK